MDSFQAWSCVAEYMDHSSLANTAKAFGEDCEPGAAVRKERRMRYEFVYSECEEDLEWIRSLIVERKPLRPSLERFFANFAKVLSEHKGRSDDSVDLFVHSMLQPEQVALFSEDHYLASRMLLPLSMRPRPEVESLSPLTRVADMIERLEPNRVAHALMWVFLDALGLEDGSFVFMMLMVGVRKPVHLGRYCSPALHPLLVLASECWDTLADSRTRIGELVSRGRAAVASSRTRGCNLEMARRILHKFPMQFSARRSGYRDYKGIKTGDFSTFEEWRAEARKMFEECIGAYEANLRKVRDMMLRDKSAKMANAALVFEREVWSSVMRFKRATCCNSSV
eukprot:jgi/Mesvir1/14662/Mv26251-RA.1